RRQEGGRGLYVDETERAIEIGRCRRTDGRGGHHDSPIEDRVIMPGLHLGEEGAHKEREKDQCALGVPELQSHRQCVTAGLAQRGGENPYDPERKRNLRHLAENISLVRGLVSSRVL